MGTEGKVKIALAPSSCDYEVSHGGIFTVSTLRRVGVSSLLNVQAGSAY